MHRKANLKTMLICYLDHWRVVHKLNQTFYTSPWMAAKKGPLGLPRHCRRLAAASWKPTLSYSNICAQVFGDKVPLHWSCSHLLAKSQLIWVFIFPKLKNNFRGYHYDMTGPKGCARLTTQPHRWTLPALLPRVEETSELMLLHCFRKTLLWRESQQFVKKFPIKIF